MKDNKPNLKSAYALETVEDNLELYANWASDYENGFASKMDYILPNQVAQIFSDMGGKGPVLDVGAGTGLGGLALAKLGICLLYTSPSPRDRTRSRMPSSA